LSWAAIDRDTVCCTVATCVAGRNAAEAVRARFPSFLNTVNTIQGDLGNLGHMNNLFCHRSYEHSAGCRRQPPRLHNLGHNLHHNNKTFRPTQEPPLTEFSCYHAAKYAARAKEPSKLVCPSGLAPWEDSNCSTCRPLRRFSHLQSDLMISELHQGSFEPARTCARSLK
jgi:hypothetical protein